MDGRNLIMKGMVDGMIKSDPIDKPGRESKKERDPGLKRILALSKHKPGPVCPIPVCCCPCRLI